MVRTRRGDATHELLANVRLALGDGWRTLAVVGAQGGGDAAMVASRLARAAAANVVGTLVLARLWGGYGAAASSAVAVALSSGVALNRYYAREVGLCMRRWWASCLRLAMPLVGMTAAFAALWGAVPHPATWGVLALGMLAYAAAFVAVAWTLSANGYERGLVRGVAGRLVRGARTWAHGAQGEAMQQTSKGTEQQ